MKIEIVFPIYERPRGDSPSNVDVFIEDTESFLRLWEVAPASWKEHSWPPGEQRSHLWIKASPDDPVLLKMLMLLREMNWFPYYGIEVPEAMRTTHFQMLLARRYEPRDFNKTSYLKLDILSEDGLAPFNERRGDRWVGVAERACWKVRIAMMGGGYNAFVSDELREHLEGAGLKGLKFYPVEWDDPKRAKGRFWELDSEVTMPSCLLPTVQSVTARMLDGSKQFGTFYDDACYRPLELVFRESEVKALGDFDIARTRESLVWTRPDVGDHKLVVSQKFRKTLKELRVKDVGYGVVHLVSDDWQRAPNDPDRLPTTATGS